MKELGSKIINKLKEDGVDHVRISLRSKVKLGKLLFKDLYRVFTVPGLGSFTTSVNFANWLASKGNEEARHDKKFKVKGRVDNFRSLILYAKYYQLLNYKSEINKDHASLFFIGYNVHSTGIVELDRWSSYADSVKKFVNHLLDETVEDHSIFPDKEIQELVDKFVTKIKTNPALVNQELPTVRVKNKKLRYRNLMKEDASEVYKLTSKEMLNDND